MNPISCRNYSPPSLRSKPFHFPYWPTPLTWLSHSHERIRDMEHELFQSKLKPSVDAALLSEMIRSSLSGGHPHRAAAMELIFERSIRERHGRMLTKEKRAVRPNPAPQPEESEDTPGIPIPQVQSPAPVSAPQSQSQSLPDSAGIGLPTRPASASVESKAPSKSSTLSRPAKKKNRGVRHEESPTDAKVNSPPSRGSVELACRSCNTKRPRSRLLFDICCTSCFTDAGCAGCGTPKTYGVGVCGGCHKKFKW